MYAFQLYAGQIRALLYPWQGTSPRGIPVPFQGDRRHPQRRRYLYVAPELTRCDSRDYVHDVILDGTYAGRRYTFRVFFRRDCRLKKNAAIRRLSGGGQATFEGDVLVVAMGPRSGLRNLRGALERRAADFCICRYVLHTSNE